MAVVLCKSHMFLSVKRGWKRREYVRERRLHWLSCHWMVCDLMCLYFVCRHEDAAASTWCEDSTELPCINLPKVLFLVKVATGAPQRLYIVTHCSALCVLSGDIYMPHTAGRRGSVPDAASVLSQSLREPVTSLPSRDLCLWESGFLQSSWHNGLALVEWWRCTSAIISFLNRGFGKAGEQPSHLSSERVGRRE